MFSALISRIAIVVIGAMLASYRESPHAGSSGLPPKGHPASEFFSEFRFDPLPVIDGTDEIAVPWVANSAPGPSGTTIFPAEHDPEREIRMVFSKIADGEPSDLSSFWTMILAGSLSPADPTISWERHPEAPHLAYGSYSAGDGRAGRIWISLASNDGFDKVELHLRMTEEHDKKSTEKP